MAKKILHRQALKLRKLGKSYGQIRQELGVSKSTLSVWLRKYPLSIEQLKLLRSEDMRIEKYRQTMRFKKEKKLLDYYDEAKVKILPISDKELFIAGLFLYWGEGGKTHPGQLHISNTDPSVLKFALLWMGKSLKIPKEKIQILLHLYDDMVIEEEVDYWSLVLNISKTQFVKPYIKKSKRTELDEKGYGHGACNLRVSDTVLIGKILMAIRAAADYSEDYLKRF